MNYLRKGGYKLLGGFILIILLILVIYFRINFANIKGNYGERQVNRILSRLDSTRYTIYQDLYIPTGDDKTSQVDHIVTSPYGIFVIETKHYNGWIFGNEKNRYWTQVIYKRKEKLFNPIWQNAGHVKALENYLKTDKKIFTSIIAFSNQSTFKFKEPFTRARVIHFPNLIPTITENNKSLISEKQLNEINRMLNELKITDNKIKKEVGKAHVQAIKLDHAKEKVPYFDKTKCPKCHSNLERKSGKYGSFMGCSDFPKCRYTRKIG